MISNVDLSAIDFSDVDAASSTLTVTLSTNTGGQLSASSGGGVTVGGTAAAMTFSGTLNDLNAYFNNASNIQYLHATPGITGDNIDTITVVINDNGNTGAGGGTDQTLGTVNVDVAGVNDAPVNTVPGMQTVAEETTTAISGVSITDSDAGSNNVSTRLQVSNGVLNVTLSGSATISAGGNGSGDLTILGTVTDINATLVSLTYTGNSDVVGNAADTLTVTTDDLGNTGSGGALTDVDTVQIDITAVNDTPVVSGPGSAYTVNEQTNLSIEGTGFTVNDVDAATGTMTATIDVGEGAITIAAGDSGVSISSGNGTGTVTVTGTLTQIDNLLTGSSTGTISYFNSSDTPSASTTITVTVNDGGNTGTDPGLTGDASSEEDSASQTINLTALNDDPTNAGSLPSDITVTEDVISNVDLSAVDFSDVDATSSTLTVTLSTSTGGQLSASSGGGVTVGGTATATTFTGTLNDLNTYFNTASNIQYQHATPHLNGDNADTITVVINDNGNTGVGGGADQTLGVVNVDIAAVNDAPVNTVPGTQTVAEETATAIAGVSISDVDSGGSNLTTRLQVSNGSLNVTLSGSATISAGVNGSGDLTLQGSAADINATLASLTYTGNTDLVGTAADTLTVTTNDLGNTGSGGPLTDVDTVQIDITAVNDTPVVNGPGSAYLVNEQTNLSIEGTGFTVADVDAASGTMTATISVGEGAITIAAGDSGVTISSGNGTGSVVVTGTLTQIDNLLTGSGTGTISYFNSSDTPSASTTITVTVNDGGNTGADPGLTGDGSSEEDSASQTINLASLNDTPVVSGPGSAYTVNEQTNLTIEGTGFTVADVDVATGTMTATIDVGEGAITIAAGDSGVTISSGNGTGTVTVTGTLAQIDNLLTGAGTGTITYFNNSDTPSASTTITVTLNDGGNTGADPGLTGDASSEEDSASQTINLTAINDNPTNAGSLPSDITVTEDVLSNVDLSAVDFSDVDAASSTLTVTLSTSTGGQLSASTGGGVTVGGTAAAMTFTGTLNDLNTYFNDASNIQYLHSTPGITGNDIDTITVVINDNGNTGLGGGTDQTLGVVNVDVAGVNDAPVNTVPGTQSVAEETATTISGISIADSDAGSNNLTTRLQVSNGVLNVTLSGSATLSAGGNGSGDLTIQGSVAEINATLASLTYTGNTNVVGSAADTLTVTTDDLGNTGSGGALTDVDTVQIDITAVNDSPVVNGPGSAYTVNEQTSLTIDGTGFTVADVDADSGTMTATINVGEGAITVTAGDSGITITGGNGTGTVTVTGTLTQIDNLLTGSSTGTISYFNSSDTPSASTTITVTVNDGGNTGTDPGLTGDASSEEDSASQTINLTALNDDPTNAGSLPSDITVTEDVISNVDLSAVDFSDLDAASSTLTVTLSTSTGGQLSASSGGGVTVGGTATATTFTGTLNDLNTYFDTASNIQYQHVTPHLNGNDADTITVVINDNGNTGVGGGTDQTLGVVNVDITAVNDAPVVATNTGMTVTEGSTSNVISNAMLNEGDVDDDGAGLTYTVTSVTANGVLRNNGTALGLNDTFTQADLDAGLITYDHDDSETPTDSFNFTLADGGEDGAIAASGTFNISITLINDNSTTPITDTDPSADFVFENAIVGTTIGVTAFADDVDTADSITYTLDDNDGGRFAIHGTSGVVSVAGAIDREADGPTRTITVRAESTDGSFQTRTFTISIGDVDEFDVGSVSDTNVAINEVDENAVAGTAVGIVAAASDLDATTNTITYTLQDNDGGRFAIDANTGVVTVAGAIDREADGATRNITVRASSVDGSFTDQLFTININDVDEFDVGPLSDTDGSANLVAENALNGTAVGITVLAIDADATNNTVLYTLDDTAGGRFTIDNNSGLVTVADGTLLDREASSSHDITVRATSSDGSFITQVITVAVDDVDEFDVGPVTDIDLSSNNVDENAVVGTTVGITASASDDDATNSTVTYSLQDNDGGRFAIDSSTGVVSVAGAIDREADGPSRTITVRASSTDGSFTDQVFAISINDLDEYDIGPIVDSDPAANSVDENSVFGTVVGVTSLAIDLDATDVVTYSLDDNAGGRFSIDNNSGVVTVSGSLDHESSSSHNITIRASSTDGSTATQVLLISVSDINEAPTAVSDAYTVDPGTTMALGAPGVLFNDYDVDGNPIMAVIVTPPNSGSATLLADGTLIYTPNAGFFGVDTVHYRVSDGSLMSSVVTIEVTVQAGTTSGTDPDPPPNEGDEPDAPPVPPPDAQPEPESDDDNDPGEETVDFTPTPTPTQPAPRSSPGFEREQEERDVIARLRLQTTEIDSSLLEFLGGSSSQLDSVSSQRSAELELLERIMRIDLERSIVWQDWDGPQDSPNESFLNYVAGPVSVGAGMFSIGYVLWALRGGAFMAALSSALPAWRLVDPTALLAAYRNSTIPRRDDIEKLL